MWPRQLLGYDRLERAELVEPIGALYQEVWGPLMNFFLPGLKLKEKWREKKFTAIPQDSRKTCRKHGLFAGFQSCGMERGGFPAGNLREHQ